MFSYTSGLVFAFCCLTNFVDSTDVISRVEANLEGMKVNLNNLRQATLPEARKELDALNVALGRIAPDMTSLLSNPSDPFEGSLPSVTKFSNALLDVNSRFSRAINAKRAAITELNDTATNEMLGELLQALGVMLTNIVDPFQQKINHLAYRAKLGVYRERLVQSQKDILYSLHDLVQTLCPIQTDTTSKLSHKVKVAAAVAVDGVRGVVDEITYLKCLSDLTICSHFLIRAANEVKFKSSCPAGFASPPFTFVLLSIMGK